MDLSICAGDGTFQKKERRDLSSLETLHHLEVKELNNAFNSLNKPH
jgi:hypothetical protein